MTPLWLATLAILAAAILVVVLLVRRPGFVGGGFRAESWTDRQLCALLHRGKHSWLFSSDGTRRRSCTVEGCNMLVVQRPLRLRVREKAREAATDELQKWARR